MIIIDLSPANAVLYKRLQVEMRRGTPFLLSPPLSASQIFRENLEKLLNDTVRRGETEVTFTGAMSPWVYLLAGILASQFGFSKVLYTDGDQPIVLYADA